MRMAHVTDPDHMDGPAGALIGPDRIAAMAAAVDPDTALPWPQPAAPGDTVWIGVVDAHGRAVSFIHSIYWEFGSGVVLRDTGIQWQNRGCSFELDPAGRNALLPGRRPFHTNNPAMALFDDGRVMPYGTMGGEGQPQTQAAVFARHAWYGQDLQTAITAPRWLLGRRWGEERTALAIESRFPGEVLENLRARGHDLDVAAPFTELMGHAGAIVLSPSGVLEGAADPRGDGVAAGY